MAIAVYLTALAARFAGKTTDVSYIRSVRLRSSTKVHLDAREPDRM